MQVLVKGNRSEWRVYKSERARAIALWNLRNRGWRYNYFVLYRDVNGPAINMGWADWVQSGTSYVSH